MKNAFINSTEDVFSANEAQVKKIEFLTHQKQKTDSYIKDIEESLKFNKEAVRSLNKDGPNNTALAALNDENTFLHKKLQISYEQNRDLNALRLFEAQIRIQDKSFYNERVLEFQTRISDLRKYLHDKQDSFTNVVNRLKKYEEIQEMTMKQKLSEFKNQIGQPIHFQLFHQISQERNFYKEKCDTMENATRKLEIVQFAIQNQGNFQAMIKAVEKFEKKGKGDYIFEEKMRTIVPSNVQEQIDANLKENASKPTTKGHTDNPNTELIRLLKKQKLENEIFEQTLNDAIQKNQELLNVNQHLADANNMLEQTCNELRSEIMVMYGRLADFDENYRRRVKEYSKCDIDKPKPENKYNDFPIDITRKGLLRKIKKDVDMISSFMNSYWGYANGSNGHPKQQTENKFAKSSSEPQLTIDAITEDDFEIEAH